MRNKTCAPKPTALPSCLRTWRTLPEPHRRASMPSALFPRSVTTTLNCATPGGVSSVSMNVPALPIFLVTPSPWPRRPSTASHTNHASPLSQKRVQSLRSFLYPLWLPDVFLLPAPCLSFRIYAHKLGLSRTANKRAKGHLPLISRPVNSISWSTRSSFAPSGGVDVP